MGRAWCPTRSPVPLVSPEGFAGHGCGVAGGVMAAPHGVMGPEWSHCGQLGLQPNASRSGQGPVCPASSGQLLL